MDNQSQKRCIMDSLKEKDKPATKPSKRPRIEAAEEQMRRMFAKPVFMDPPAVIPQ